MEAIFSQPLSKFLSSEVLGLKLNFCVKRPSTVTALILILAMLQDYPIEKKWEGRGSKIEMSGARLICGSAAWKSFWARHAGEGSEVPPVDFTTHAVLAVFPEGRFHSILSSASSDGKRVTVTTVVGMKEATEYVPHHSILVIPRTPLPLRVVVRQNTCIGIDESRDRSYVVPTSCQGLDRCNKGGGGFCAECGKKSLDADALCAECSKAAGRCRRCGLPPAKP